MWSPKLVFSLLVVGLIWTGLFPGCATVSPADEEPEFSADDIDWPQGMNAEPRDLVPTANEPETVLIAGATVLTAVGEPIEDGYVLLEDGKIVEVSAEAIEAPEGAEVIDAAGKFVTPGLIDTHSHLGVYPTPYVGAHYDGNEATAPTTPQVDAAHSVWPQDPGFEKALAGGVTALQVLPGSANIIGGRAVTLALHPGVSSQAMAFESAPDGLKMACGENPKRVYGGRGTMPSTRMGTMAVWRATFQKARETRRAYQEYREALARWKSQEEPDPKAEPKPPARDFGMETLLGALDGDILLHVHCYRADEIVQVLEMADEFGLKIRSFHHALEAYKIRDLLAEWDVAVSTWADWWGFKMEMNDGIRQNAALIEQAGGRSIIHSDSAVGIQRLNQEAAKAYWAAKHAGVEVTRQDALRWITINPAWALGIDEDTGSLEPGKRADVVLWSADPFSVYAHADKVWVEGVREFDRDKSPAPWSDFEVGQFIDDVGPMNHAGPISHAGPANDANSKKVGPEPSDQVDATAATVLKGATIHTVSGEVIDEGVVVIDANGNIKSVGDRSTALSKGADVVDVSGKVITPGLVESFTSMGVVEVSLEGRTVDRDAGGDDPIRAAFEVIDGFNPNSVLIPVTRASGVTSVVVVPSGGLVSGQAAWAKLGPAAPATSSTTATVGTDPVAMLINLGERGAQAAGGSRGAAMESLRELYDDVSFYRDNTENYDQNRARTLAATRIDLRSLEKTLEGRLPVMFRANRASDIRTVLKFADEVGVKPIIVGGAEAWRLADDLADADVAVVVNPLENLPARYDQLGARADNAAILAEAGVPVVLSTFSTHNVRNLRQIAGNAVRAGMSHSQALEAVTAAPARALGQSGIGTILAGAPADLVVWSGDPFELSTKVERLYINGETVSLDNRQDQLLERYRKLPRRAAPAPQR
jgi:imidazolonepropionase-like amidohydrolase